LHAALPLRNRARAIVGVMPAAPNGGTEMTDGSTYDRWPDQSDQPEQPEQPDEEYPDCLWPDDKDDQESWPVPPAPFPARGARERRRSLIALTVTAVVAVGLGAGAVLVYRNAQADSAPSVAASHNNGLTPSQGGAPAVPGTATEMELLGQVTAVGSASLTIGGGPVQPVRAAVTSATRFTGTVRTLAAVRVGNVVEAQIAVTNGKAKLVSLQDPASES
jgi:hypothetical protein